MFVNNSLGGVHSLTLRLPGLFSHVKVTRLCGALNERAGLFLYGVLALTESCLALRGRFEEAVK